MVGGPSPDLDWGAQAPAATLRSFRRKADAEMGGSAKLGLSNNAARDAHRFVRRLGLSWNVPQSYVTLSDEDSPETISAPYLSPKAWILFLLKRAPELLMGGHTDLATGQTNLCTFWDAYQKIHPEHAMFQLPDHEERKSRTLCMSLHGDEGRGLKKGHTCVVMLETNLGLQTIPKKRKAWNSMACQECYVPEPYAKRCRTSAGYQERPGGDLPAISQQVTNITGHPFLTKFVLFVLPSKMYKNEGTEGFLDKMLDRAICELRELATDGVDVNGAKWYAQLTGCKGDLDWFRVIASLKRCWKKQLGQGLAMCHECNAGTEQLPFEDCSHQPKWLSSLWFQRPWEAEPLITKLIFEPQRPERILRRDIFHNTKTGMFRDFCGSSVLLLCRLGYFDLPNESNRREILLSRAHSWFRMWCIAEGKSPGLHSFTPMFFNAPSQSSYGWTNSKGSDTMLLIGWLETQVAAFERDPKDESHLPTLKLMREAARCANQFTSMQYTHGLWLSRHCSAQLYTSMHKFLKAYDCLAFWSLHQFGFCAYAKKSKQHMICHAKQDVLRWLSDRSIQFLPNPQIWGCEANEDVIGKISRLSRRVSHQQVCLRTLQLYLIKCKSLHRRFREFHSSPCARLLG